jgi:hypothetical protein
MMTGENWTSTPELHQCVWPRVLKRGHGEFDDTQWTSEIGSDHGTLEDMTRWTSRSLTSIVRCRTQEDVQNDIVMVGAGGAYSRKLTDCCSSPGDAIRDRALKEMVNRFGMDQAAGAVWRVSLVIAMD